ncbi:MAG: hypothetical protein ACR2RD_10835, partial [Woeseiaceae bacterium]
LLALVGLRFLLAGFFTGIAGSCRGKKRPGLYMALRPMEGLFLLPFSEARGAPEGRIFTGLSRDLSF